MQKLAYSIGLRYFAAILLTALIMVWQSTDVVRVGSEFRSLALFWFAAVTAGWLQMILIARGVRASFGPDRYPGWALLLISSLLGAVPLTFQVRWLVETIVAPAAGLPAPWITYLNICVINVVFSLIQFMLIERWPLFHAVNNEVQNWPAEPNHDRARLEAINPVSRERDLIPTVGMLRHRPEGLNGTIQFMRMEDHYLHVYTEHGSALTLYRMIDAIADLENTNGRQVHKSWWVSRNAISEIKKNGRSRSILTRDGTVIPIGRSFEKPLRDSGWL